MAKHHPRPIASANGCTAATAAPAPRHLTMLIAAEAVADRCMFRSVSKVPVIANRLAVVTPVRNCMMIMTEICVLVIKLAHIPKCPNH